MSEEEEDFSVEEELWNVFTFYTLRGDPMDPEHMSKREFVKFCRDSLIVPRPDTKDPFLTKETRERIETSEILLQHIVSRHSNYIKNMLSTAEIHVIYTSVIRRSNRTTHKDKMNYNDFLNALMKISIEMYGTEKSVSSTEDAFQNLLIENILNPGLSRRRKPRIADLRVAMRESETKDFLEKYKAATRQIFRFYAACRRQKIKGLKAGHKKDLHVGDKDFEAMSLEKLKITAGRLDREWRRDPSKRTVSYDDFFKFTLDFDLTSSLAFSSIEMGTVYLSAIHKKKSQSGNVRNLTHDDFQRALVYCAIVAYEKKMKAYAETPDADVKIQLALKAYQDNRVTTVDKIRSLFLHMWRAVHDEKNVPKARVHLLNVNTHAMDIFNASKKFRVLFNKEWQEDGYRDYLNPIKDEEEDEEMILDQELKLLVGNVPVRMRKTKQSVTTTSYASPPPVRSPSKIDGTTTSYDATSMETIREYLDTRPELKGILDTTSSSSKEGQSDFSFLNEDDNDDNVSSPPRCEISLGQYEKAMAALKSEVPLGAFD